MILKLVTYEKRKKSNFKNLIILNHKQDINKIEQRYQLEFILNIYKNILKKHLNCKANEELKILFKTLYLSTVIKKRKIRIPQSPATIGRTASFSVKILPRESKTNEATREPMSAAPGTVAPIHDPLKMYNKIFYSISLIVVNFQQIFILNELQ